MSYGARIELDRPMSASEFEAVLWDGVGYSQGYATKPEMMADFRECLQENGTVIDGIDVLDAEYVYKDILKRGYKIVKHDIPSWVFEPDEFDNKFDPS